MVIEANHRHTGLKEASMMSQSIRPKIRTIDGLSIRYAESEPRDENSYSLSTNLPNAVLLTYPDSGHGSLFQFHESFTWKGTAFIASDSRYAPY